MNVGDKYLTNIEEIQMTKEKENYLLSSLNEYLSILDNESSTSSAKTPSNVMSRSGVTNPISKTKTKENNLISGNGLIIKSGHSINSDTGIYLVNVDGVSAIVGKIKESTFMLKKFDRVVTEPLQVRRDEDNVYIVRVGEFKCLVDISKDRMGTLIEI
jgi:hypothetical protein